MLGILINTLRLVTNFPMTTFVSMVLELPNCTPAMTLRYGLRGSQASSDAELLILNPHPKVHWYLGNADFKF